MSLVAQAESYVFHQNYQLTRPPAPRWTARPINLSVFPAPFLLLFFILFLLKLSTLCVQLLLSTSTTMLTKSLNLAMAAIMVGDAAVAALGIPYTTVAEKDVTQTINVGTSTYTTAVHIPAMTQFAGNVKGVVAYAQANVYDDEWESGDGWNFNRTVDANVDSSFHFGYLEYSPAGFSSRPITGGDICKLDPLGMGPMQTIDSNSATITPAPTTSSSIAISGVTVRGQGPNEAGPKWDAFLVEGGSYIMTLDVMATASCNEVPQTFMTCTPTSTATATTVSCPHPSLTQGYTMTYWPQIACDLPLEVIPTSCSTPPWA